MERPLNIEQFNLGKEAYDYLAERLQGGLTLSKKLLQSVELDSGRIFTYLPVGTDLKSRSNFSVGGVLKVQVHSGQEISGTTTPNLDWLLLERIEDYISSSEGLVLLENALGNPSDSVLKANFNLAASMRHCGDEVYHYLDKHNKKEAIISEAVSASANSWQFVACFCPEDSVSSFQEKTLSDVELETIAANAECIVVNAYDGESFMFWVKS